MGVLSNYLMNFTLFSERMSFKCTFIMSMGVQDKMNMKQCFTKPYHPNQLHKYSIPNSNFEQTIKGVGLPIDQRFTFLSSPPVINWRHAFFPILKQFTLPECAANSSTSISVKKNKHIKQKQANSATPENILTHAPYSVWLARKCIERQ